MTFRRIPAVCAAVAIAAGSVLAPGAAAAGSLSGKYRVTLAARDLVRVGASAREVGWDVGTWTLALGHERWTLRQADGRYGNALDRGDVALDGSSAAFTMTSADGYRHGEFVGTVRWHASAGALRFSVAVRPRSADLLEVLVARPWLRIR
jgi:hypothetical protein